jgi:wyosine [tRNA(Phe)-imidazoG37] synthetase (radical SAM superfamily)
MEQIYEGLMEGFTYHLAHRTPIDYITFAGHGEPTLHPAFAEIVDGVLGLRDEYFPGKPTAIFSNASLLHRPEVVAGIAKLDKRIMKFDAADEATFRQIDKPLVDITFAQMVENLRRLDGLILTSGVLASARYSNVESLKSADYIEAIGSIQPLEVHLYSIDHPTGYKGISRVSRELMEDIAQWLHGRTGVMVKVLQNRNPRRHAYVRARHAVD